MRRVIICLVIFLLGTSLSAQKLAVDHDPEFKAMFDSLNVISKKMIMGKGAENRMQASYSYLSLLEENLNKYKGFEYPFDSLQHISIITSDDNKIRIFTWDLLFAENRYRHLGIIQYKDKKDNVTLKVLNDYSDNIVNPMDTINSADRWYGCFYYNIISKKSKGLTKYYLFGWDMNNRKTYKKLVDVLYIVKGEIVFGSKDFLFEEYNNEIHSKYIMEYEKNATTTLNYDKEKQMIIFDSMRPLGKSNIGNGDQNVLIPDGSYHGFKWKKGKWIFVDKIFHFKLKDGEAPIGQ